jgi:hypothetical protein
MTLSGLLQNQVILPLRTTADKRLHFTPPKLPSATSFICRPLYDAGVDSDQELLGEGF